MTELLNDFSNLMKDNLIFAPIFAFLAGILASFMPCSLSSIPLIIGYVGGTQQKNTKTALKLSLMFVLGSAVTFTALGTAASLAGRLIGNFASWWYIVLGILMVLMALQVWEIIQVIPSSFLTSKNHKKGYLGALTTGILAGVFSSPCSTPVLVAILAIVAGKGSILWGVVLLLLYSAGHGILAVISGTSVSFVKKLSSSEKYGKISLVLKIVLGLAILAVGLYMFYLAF